MTILCYQPPVVCNCTSEGVSSSEPHKNWLKYTSLQLNTTQYNLLILRERMMVNYVRQREPAELTAVVEALPQPGDETAMHSQRILADRQIALQPLAGLDDYAQSIQREPRA